VRGSAAARGALGRLRTRGLVQEAGAVPQRAAGARATGGKGGEGPHRAGRAVGRQGGNQGPSGVHSEAQCARRRPPRRTKQHTNTIKRSAQQPEHKGGAQHGGQARQGHTAGTDGCQRAQHGHAYNATRSIYAAYVHNNNKANTQEYAHTAQGAQDGRDDRPMGSSEDGIQRCHTGRGRSLAAAPQSEGFTDDRAKRCVYSDTKKSIGQHTRPRRA
jgi:hypothetical protein